MKHDSVRSRVKPVLCKKCDRVLRAFLRVRVDLI